MKRLLSLVLALVMLISVVPVGAFATETGEDEIITEEALDQPEIVLIEEPAEEVEEVEEAVLPAEEEQEEAEPEEEPAVVEPEEEPVEEVPSEEVTEEPEEVPEEAEEAEEIPEETEEEVLPVKVEFLCAEGVVVSVFAAETDAQMAAEEDGSFLLMPGQYYYTAECEGEVVCDKLTFTVADEALQITVVGGTLTTDPVEAEGANLYTEAAGARFDAVNHILYIYWMDGDAPAEGALWNKYAKEIRYVFFDNIENDDPISVGKGWFTKCSQISKVLYAGQAPVIDPESGLAGIDVLKYAFNFTVPEELSEELSVDLSTNGSTYQLPIEYIDGDFALLNCNIWCQEYWGEDFAQVDSTGRITFIGLPGECDLYVEGAVADREGNRCSLQTHVVVSNGEAANEDGTVAFETWTLASVNDEFPVVAVKYNEDGEKICDLSGELVGLELISGNAVEVSADSNMITAVRPGTAVVRAFLKTEVPATRIGDGLLTVRVLRNNAVWFSAVGMEEDVPLLKLDVAPTVRTIPLEMWSEDGEQAAPSAYTFSSSDSTVAKVSLDKAKKNITLTIPKNANGSCTITATPVDKTRAQETVTMTVQVRDYTPKLDKNKITVNPKLDETQRLQIQAGYHNLIHPFVSIVEADGAGGYVESDKFNVFTYQEDPTDCLYVYLSLKDEYRSLKNQTMKLKLCVQTDREEPYYLDLTVTIKSSVPKVKVKLMQKANLFEGSVSVYQVTASGYEIEGWYYYHDEDLEEINNERLSLNAPGWQVVDTSTEKGSPMLVYVMPVSSAPAKKGTLKVRLEGVVDPISVPISLSYVNKKPSLSFVSPSMTINAADVHGDYGFAPGKIRDKATKELCDLSAYNVTVPEGYTYEVNQIEDEYNDGYYSIGTIIIPEEMLHVSAKTTYKIPVQLSQDGWASPITLTYSVIVLPETAKPTVKLAKSSVTINQRYMADMANPYDSDEWSVFIPYTVSQATNVTWLEAPVCTKPAYNDSFSFAPMDWNEIAVKLNKPVPAGTYTFMATPSWNDQKLNPVKLTVKVIDKPITLSVSAKGKLDAVQGYYSEIKYYITAKNAEWVQGNPYEMVHLASPAAALKAGQEDGSELFNAYLGEDDKGMYVGLFMKTTAKYDVKKTYKFRIGFDFNSEVVYTKDISLKLSQSKPKMVVSAYQNVVHQCSDSWTSLNFEIAPAKPDSGVFGSIEKIAVDWKTVQKDPALYKALTKVEYRRYVWSADLYGAASVFVGIENAATLKAGKTYKIPVLVTFKNLAAPVKLNLPFTVKK